MKTPEEARKTWCPFARKVAGEFTASANRCRSALDEEDPRCLADECSQWVWGEPREECRVYQDAAGRFPKDYERTSPQGCAVLQGELWVYEYTDVDEHGRFDLLHRAGGEKRGFCGRNVGMALKVFGLAGKP